MITGSQYGDTKRRTGIVPRKGDMLYGDRKHGDTVKPQSSKAELRSEIEEQVSDYLRRGGAVETVSRGVSGRDSHDGPLPGFSGFSPRPREQRTYLPEVVAAIEARKRRPKPPEHARNRKPRLVRRAIYDDFGEPIRWEWVEEWAHPENDK